MEEIMASDTLSGLCPCLNTATNKYATCSRNTLLESSRSMTSSTVIYEFITIPAFNLGVDGVRVTFKFLVSFLTMLYNIILIY